jgi:hypothetical protein
MFVSRLVEELLTLSKSLFLKEGCASSAKQLFFLLHSLIKCAKQDKNSTV